GGKACGQAHCTTCRSSTCYVLIRNCARQADTRRGICTRSARQFSTAIVGAFCTSLWTTTIPRLLAGTCHALMISCPTRRRLPRLLHWVLLFLLETDDETPASHPCVD